MSRRSHQAVYQLDIDHDDPRIERFAGGRSPSLLGSRGWHHNDRLTDFFPPKPLRRNWKPPRLAPLWKPLRVSGRIRAWNDFPMLMHLPAFSQRAVDALRDVLEANGELLPLRYDYGHWWAYNLLTVADIVDMSKSLTFDGTPHPAKIQVTLTYFSIDPKRISDLMIFRLRNDVSDTYVTQPFVDRVRAAGLRNFVFKRIWPWPKGTYWGEEDKKLRAAERTAGRLPDTSSFRNQSVVIRLGYGKKSRRPTAEQKAAINKIMDKIDALLADPKAPPDAPVLGTLEGDEAVSGEHRLFVSCPLADVLVEKLQPLLRNLRWKNPVVVVKRYGDMRDESAREENHPW